jgi:hypothetical protein
MFRERPLTWLFILATVVVDLALNFGERSDFIFPVRTAVHGGFIWGQVAAVAIWAAIGQSHRLTRGSLLVVAIGTLAIVPGYLNVRSYSNTLTIMAAYALIVVAASLVVIWLRTQVRIKFDGDREQSPLKIPLIEFFGWTIVVAIASFGARYMNLTALMAISLSPSDFLLMCAVAPIALLLFDSRFSMLHLAKAVLFVGGVYLVFTVLQIGLGSELVMTSHATYLTAWLLVRSIEYDQLKTVAENDDSAELDADE